MHTTKVIKNFTETELKKNIDNDASWHQDVKTIQIFDFLIMQSIV